MEYASILLDCDGVILDSNQIKTDSFVSMLVDYNENQIKEFIIYHQQHGGVSRFKKIEYFLTDLIGKYSDDEYQRLLHLYQNEVVKKLKKASFTEGALEFINRYYKDSTLFVVSGGYEQELREVFDDRDASHYFRVILGSPIAKNEHVDDLVNKKMIDKPVLFIGDSMIDHQVANSFDIDFIFISDYTELDNWKGYCLKHDVENFTTIREMMLMKGWI